MDVYKDVVGVIFRSLETQNLGLSRAKFKLSTHLREELLRKKLIDNKILTQKADMQFLDIIYTI